MNSVNKTLYIPLYGKAYVSERGLFLDDKTAEAIWRAEGFPLKGKARSKWLAYYMGIRSAVFDAWLKRQMAALPNAVVLHIGCGLDSRVTRVGTAGHTWYDVDFSEVIAERKRYFAETDTYRMIEGDVREGAWLSSVKETQSAIAVMEGVSMYLTIDEMHALADRLCARFERVVLLLDAYSSFAARMSKRRNPINDVGVTEVYGVDDPKDFETDRLAFTLEHAMTPQGYVDELKGSERFIFSRLYAGGFSKKLYRLFEYQTK